MIGIPIPVSPPAQTTDGSGPLWIGAIIMAVAIVAFAIYAWGRARAIRRAHEATSPEVSQIQEESPKAA